MELFHNAPATPPAPGSCDGRSRNRRIRTHWRQLPRLRGAKVTKQVRAGEKLHQEGYSKSARNIIRSGHSPGGKAIIPGKHPVRRTQKKDPHGSFLPYRGNAIHRLRPASRDVSHACACEADCDHAEILFRRAYSRPRMRLPSPVTLRIRAFPEGSNPPPSRFSPSSGKRMSIGWAKTKRAPEV